MLLLELNRLLRPGGFFVWSATPVYQKLPEDVEIWDGQLSLVFPHAWTTHHCQSRQTRSIDHELVTTLLVSWVLLQKW
jgi:hypothetical protein